MTTTAEPSTPVGSAQVIDLSSKLPQRDQRQADRRWGREVMARGYTILPALMIRAQHRLGLSPEHFNVLAQLAYHWWTAGDDPHPSKKTIAGRIGKSEKQVQRYCRELENAKLIRRDPRFQTGKGQTSNSYDLSGLVARLQVIADEDAVAAAETAKRRQSIERRGNRREAS